MSIFDVRKCLVASALLLFVGSAAQASTLWVNCGGKGGVNSVGAALKALQFTEPQGPNVINVSGACHENLLIKNMDLLTIYGSNGASITDASGGTADVVDIRNSRVTISGMTIDGLNSINFDTIDCEQLSRCTLTGNTLQGGADVVGVYTLASAQIVGGVIQNGTSDGIFALGDVAAAGVTIQGNPVGVVGRRGARVSLLIADPASDPVHALTQTTVANNTTGVLMTQGSEFSCAGCLVQNNNGDGIHLDVSVGATIQLTFSSNGSTVPVVNRRAKLTSFRRPTLTRVGWLFEGSSVSDFI
jgi:Right handed beta helix region